VVSWKMILIHSLARSASGSSAAYRFDLAAVLAVLRDSFARWGITLSDMRAIGESEGL
jgi:hypothetical protein